MLREIYCKPINDPTYQNDIFEHEDIYEAVLSKIRMILFTTPGEVLGEPNFGVDLERYIFDTMVSNKELKKMILEQIVMYIPESNYFNIDVDVKFQRGQTQDIGFIDIKLNGTPAIGILIK